MKKFLLMTAAVLAGTASVAHAQEFKFAGRTVQVHGFASQGYGYSNENNFLTMNTNHGSPALTEGAVNLSMPISEKFRVGAQGYSRKIGSLDDFRPQLDWAYGDFKVAPWLGFRGGKVKTVMGLYNDTQDMTFLYTWALLPQGIYPTDLRTTYIAHTGGDVYGRIGLKKVGKLDYTVYGGIRPYDDREGFYYYSAANGYPISKINGQTIGWDLKWRTPLKGLVVGTSWADMTQHRKGFYKILKVNYSYDSNQNRPWIEYATYNVGKWDFAGEHRYYDYWQDVKFAAAPISDNKSTTAWFASAAYRVTPKLQVGVYHSNWKAEKPATPTDTASTHIYDEVGAARYDINRFWDVKAEGHFMDGYGDSRQPQGFYREWNPQGYKPKTNLLVLRATFKF